MNREVLELVAKANSKPTSDRERRSNAFHEAGHALAAIRYGVRIDGATLAPMSDLDQPPTAGNLFPPVLGGRVYVADLDVGRVGMLVSLAGPEASHLYERRRKQSRGTDGQTARKIATLLAFRRLAPDERVGHGVVGLFRLRLLLDQGRGPTWDRLERETRRILREGREQVRDMLDAEWDRVEALALALLDRWTLTAADVAKIAGPNEGDL